MVSDFFPWVHVGPDVVHMGDSTVEEKLWGTQGCTAMAYAVNDACARPAANTLACHELPKAAASVDGLRLLPSGALMLLPQALSSLPTNVRTVHAGTQHEHM